MRMRTRLAALPAAADTGRGLVALALELRRLKRELSQALVAVRSCSSCAVGYPEPFGHWDGGHCCGGNSENLFTEDELAALKLAGTTPGKLSPPSSDLAGCVFRGPTGCSLSVDDRPSICVRYLCRTLERELLARGDKPEIVALARQLKETLDEFVRLRVAADVFPREMLDMME
jgi:hypothetical protein